MKKKHKTINHNIAVRFEVDPSESNGFFLVLSFAPYLVMFRTPPGTEFRKNSKQRSEDFMSM